MPAQNSRHPDSNNNPVSAVNGIKVSIQTGTGKRDAAGITLETCLCTWYMVGGSRGDVCVVVMQKHMDGPHSLSLPLSHSEREQSCSKPFRLPARV